MEKLEEYFAALDTELAFLEPEVRGEILSELRGHVEEKVKRHPEKPVEEILAGFGSPHDIAEKYRAEFTASQEKAGEESRRDARTPEEKLADELKRIVSEGLPQGLAALKQLKSLKELKNLKNLKGLKDLEGIDGVLKEDLSGLGKTLGRDLEKVGREMGEWGREFGREMGEWGREFGREMSRRHEDRQEESGRAGGLGAQIRGFVSSLVRGASGTDDVDTVTVDLEPEGLEAVTVELSLADVRARPSADGRIHIRYSLGGAELPEKITIVLEEGHLILNERKLTGERRRTFVQNLEVELPAASALFVATRTGDVEIEGVEGEKTLKTLSGDIAVRKCRGGVEAKSTSGDLQLRKVEGAVKVGTLSGDVDVDGLLGDLEATSSSGDLTARSVEGAVELKTISGDVELELVGAFAGANAETKSGDVSVNLPSGVNAQVEARSFHGDISLRAGGEKLTREGGAIQSTLGSGGPLLRASSMSGDVAVRAG